MLVAANYQQQDIGASYEANLLHLASAVVTRVPELDNGTQFWLSRDGGAAAFLAGPAERAEGGVTISILNLTTGGVAPIEGAVVGYPSEGIPSLLHRLLPGWRLHLLDRRGRHVGGAPVWDHLPGALRWLGANPARDY